MSHTRPAPHASLPAYRWIVGRFVFRYGTAIFLVGLWPTRLGMFEGQINRRNGKHLTVLWPTKTLLYFTQQNAGLSLTMYWHCPYFNDR